MNSTLADSNSVLSCATRIVKNDSNKMKPRVDFYLWMFGQIHAKRLLIYMQFVLVGLAIYGLTYIADPYFSSMPIPGLDGAPGFGANAVVTANIVNTTEVKRLDVSGKIAARDSESANNKRYFVLFCSILYFASAVCCTCSLACMDRTWYAGASKIKKILNPALLLVPFMISLVTLTVPLGIWTVRTFRYVIGEKCAAESNLSCLNSVTILEVICFILLPVLITWTTMGYVLYGCSLGFVYVWRRCRYQIFTEPASASFSWSFREKNGLLGMHTNSFGRFKPNPNRSFNGRGASWKSVKSTDRPTLRSYITRPNDLNSSRSSLLSGDLSFSDDVPVNDAVSFAIEASDQVSSYASYSANVSSVRRPLDTVLEEGEINEGISASDVSRKC